jgi:hypothetical protein
MKLFSVVSFLAVLVVGIMVGCRLLLLARRTRKLPELALGTTCVSTAIGGARKLAPTPRGGSVNGL